MALADVIEEAVTKATVEGIKKVVVRRLFAADVQRAINERVQQLALEITSEPEFRATVRELLLQELRGQRGE